MHTYDTQIAIVGSGPAGLATATTLQRAGFRVALFERGEFAAGVAGWPVYMKLFSTSEMVELCDYPLTIPEEKASRQQYLRYLHRFAAAQRLELHTHHAVAELAGRQGAFELRGTTRYGEPFLVRAQYVVLATGAYDHPNRLLVPGEDLPKVSHYYREINEHFGQKVLIVGGRHSASETALELCRAGIDVTICHRGPEFAGLKYWIAPDLENRIREGRIKAHLNTQVLEIRPHTVLLEERLPGADEGRRFEIENDAVLALTGYHPDPQFLAHMGVASDPQTRQPLFDPATFESTTPGVFLVGVMLAGNISGAIFIENSRHHGQRVREALRARTAQP